MSNKSKMLIREITQHNIDMLRGMVGETIYLLEVARSKATYELNYIFGMEVAIRSLHVVTVETVQEYQMKEKERKARFKHNLENF